MFYKPLMWVGMALGVALTVVSIVTMATEGYLSIFTSVAHSWSSLQVGTDLVVSLTLLCSFIVADARKNGINPWPYLLLTPFLGSFGPLAYLGMRLARGSSTTTGSTTQVPAI